MRTEGLPLRVLAWCARLFGVVVAAAACSSAPLTPTPLHPGPTSAATPAATATPVLTYTNPVYVGDFPDPFILRVGDTYYAYATNSGDPNVQVMRSANLAQWEYLGDALPRLPGWSDGSVWAPSVLPRGDQYVLYYTAHSRESDLQCISCAVSGTPEGPFHDGSDVPFLCQEALGGSIDPSPFVDDDGLTYLLWKNNGNDYEEEVAIWVQPLAGDGLSLAGEPGKLIRYDQGWEYPLIEGPSMVKAEGRYYLFYSGNAYESVYYAVGYAICDSVTGPCVKPQREPILAHAGSVVGPGGQELFSDQWGNLWMAYHAWTKPFVGYPYGKRSLRIDRVTFLDGKPVIHGPTTDAQPLR